MFDGINWFLWVFLEKEWAKYNSLSTKECYGDVNTQIVKRILSIRENLVLKNLQKRNGCTIFLQSKKGNSLVWSSLNEVEWKSQLLKYTVGKLLGKGVHTDLFVPVTKAVSWNISWHLHVRQSAKTKMFPRYCCHLGERPWGFLNRLKNILNQEGQKSLSMFTLCESSFQKQNKVM